MDETTINDAPAPGGPDTLVHGYRLGRLLGRGAQGTVYFATQADSFDSFAIKLIDTRNQAETTIQRLVRECELTVQLTHPGIVKVYEAGYWGDYIFIAMEVASGRSADTFTNGTLGWRRAVDVARHAAAALAYAHDQHHLIHRDIKPANLVIDLLGCDIAGVKIVDFGLSRSVDDQIGGLTMTGTVMGTPFFMSPEQARGIRNLTFHTDLYALGASLFWMIAGQPPFPKGTPVEILVQHCHQPAPNLHSLADCPAEVAAVVARCLAKNTSERFEGYGALISEFEHLLNYQVSSTSRDQTSSRYLHRAVSTSGRPVPTSKRHTSQASIPSTTPTANSTPPVQTRAVRPPKVVVPSLRPGTLINEHFRVTGPLGAGAMGEVYAVEDCVVEQHLALKILSREDMRRPTAVRRFQGECTALATVEHQAFPYFSGRGTFDDRDYLLMEHVRGIDLKTWLQTNGGRMGEAGALQVVQQLAHAMHRAHSKCGMVHRDIKPANLMFTYINGEAQLKIVDFGISTYIDYGDFEDFSSRTYHYIDDDAQGRAVGTPAYMSPEQCRGAPPSPMMDIYSIGCTFFNLVTGRTPYQAPNSAMMMIHHMHDEAPTFDERDHISKSSQYLLKRCLAKDPNERFANYVELLEAAKSAYSLNKTTRFFRRLASDKTPPAEG
jgi:serine/threonine protein kinase